MAGKGLAAQAQGRTPPVWELRVGLGEEQRENAETFGERHPDDGLHEDLAGRAGIATDSFSGFVADHADADGGAEQTESAADVTGDFSEEEVHVLVDGFGCGCRRARAGHAPGGKLSMGRLEGVAFLVIMIIAVVAEEADVN